jgi:O-methyltransferase
MGATSKADESPKIAPYGLGIKKYILKPLLRGIEKALPPGVFQKFYDSAFPIYQEILRQNYRALSFLRYRWSDPAAFERTRRVFAVMPYSLVGASGLEVTDWEARSLNEKQTAGDFVELGVARGGCAALLGMAAFADGAPARRLWLFDSYEGLPEPGENDFLPDSLATGDHVRPLPKGSCLGTLEEVQRLILDEFQLPGDRIEFVRGWFENTVPTRGSEISQLALLRIDGDWYDSVKVCLDGLHDKVVEDGIVIIDDYDSCIGAKRAVDEFLAAHNLSVDLHSDGRGGRWWRKPQSTSIMRTASGIPDDSFSTENALAVSGKTGKFEILPFRCGAFCG